jgi:hypothetical protein
MKLADHFYVALDCEDTVELAQFYARITGLKLETFGASLDQKVEFIELRDEQDIPKLAFQKIENYVAPTWPTGNVPQQAHLDFAVKDLVESEAKVLKLGATKTQFQPGSPKNDNYSTEFIVYLDPAGHPFCLIQRD